MKKIFFILIVFLSVKAWGQIPTGYTRYYSKNAYTGTWNVDAGNIVVKDTTTAPIGVGEVRYRTADSTVYICISTTVRPFWMRLKGYVPEGLGTGTVTSVGLNIGGSVLTRTGSPVTGTGTISLAWQGANTDVVLGDGFYTPYTTLITSVANPLYSPIGHGHIASDISDFVTAARSAFSAGTGISITDGVIAATDWTTFNSKISPSDTTGNWASNFYKRSDSVFFKKGSTEYFAFLDAGSTTTSSDSLGWVFAIDYGASGIIDSTTGSITSGSNSLTVASAANYKVGQYVYVRGAHFLGKTKNDISKITNVSGTTITTQDNAGATVSGVTVSHDDTRPINAAMQAAYDKGGTVVYLHNGNYPLRDTLIKLDWNGAQPNCQIKVPLSGGTDTLVRISLIGESFGSTVEEVVVSQPKSNSGVILTSFISGVGEDAGGSLPEPAIIGSGWAVGTFGNWNTTVFTLDNIELRVNALNGSTPIGTSLSGINGNYIKTLNWNNLKVAANVGASDLATPFRNNYGIIMPASNNNAVLQGNLTLIGGYNTAIKLQEHSNLNNLIVFEGGYGVEGPMAGHPALINKYNAENVAYAFKVRSGNLLVTSYGAEQNDNYLKDVYSTGEGGKVFINRVQVSGSYATATSPYNFQSTDSNSVRLLEINGGRALDRDTMQITAGIGRTWNAYYGRVGFVNLTSNTSITSVRNIAPGESLKLIVRQDATGGRTLSLPDSSSYSLVTTPNSYSIINGIFDGTRMIWAGLGQAAGGVGGGGTVTPTIETLASGATFTIDRSDPKTYYEFDVNQNADLVISNAGDLDDFIMSFTVSGNYTLTHNGVSLPVNPNGVNWMRVFKRNGKFTFIPSTSVVNTGTIPTQLNAPTGVTLGTATDVTQPLSWTDANSSPNETSYKVYYGTTNSFGSATLATTTAANATSYTVTGLTASTLYYYWVVAVGDGSTTSNSSPSTVVSGSTGGSLSYVNFTTLGANTTTINNGLEKATGSAGWEESGSTTPLNSGHSIIGRINTTDDAHHMVIGVSSSNAPTTTDQLTAVLYMYPGGALHKFENGTTDTPIGGSWNGTTYVKISLSGTTVSYYVSSDGVTWGSALATSTISGTVYPIVGLNTVGGRIDSIQIQ